LHDVGLVSGEVFSPFGEHWLVGSHSRAGTLFPGWMPPRERVRRCMAWTFGTGGGGVA